MNLLQVIDQKDVRPTDNVFRLKPFQDKFIFSLKRFLAFVGAWGTGKDMATIARGMRLSEEHPKNEGLIVRAEWTDLRDSTMSDFRKYTGLKPNGDNDVFLANGAKIMFRHAEQIADEKNLNNMNLGWFGIIQADEFKSKIAFEKLSGRLRRCHGVCEFAKMSRAGKDPAALGVKCSCKQSGFLSANANAEDWICELFGSGELGIKGSIPEDLMELVEAKTEENIDVLPAAYADTIRLVEKTNLPMHQRYVLNSRRVTADKFIILPYEMVRACVGLEPIRKPETKRVTVCDPAGGDVPEPGKKKGEGGGDETVIYDGADGRVSDSEIYKHVTLPDTEGRIMHHAKRNGSNMIMVDIVGIGLMLYQSLCKAYERDKSVRVIPFDGRETAPKGDDEKTYANYKTFAWFQAQKKLNAFEFAVPDDPVLHRQLSRIPYSYTRGIGGGRYQIATKDEIHSILSCSADRAEAFVMLIDAFERAEPIYWSADDGQNRDAWAAPAYAQAAARARGIVYERPR